MPHKKDATKEEDVIKEEDIKEVTVGQRWSLIGQTQSWVVKNYV